MQYFLNMKSSIKFKKKLKKEKENKKQYQFENGGFWLRAFVLPFLILKNRTYFKMRWFVGRKFF